MSILDFIILALLIVGGVHGFRKGLVIEVIAILAFILAIIGGFKLLHVGMEYLSKVYDGFGSLLPFVSFIIIFILIIILVNILGKALKKVIDWTPLGAVDSIAGAAVGILKWALGLSILFWLFDAFGFNFPEALVKNSKIYPQIQQIAPKLGEVIVNVFPSTESFFNSLKELFKKM